MNQSPDQHADYERAWNRLRVRLVERFQMASEVLKEEGLDLTSLPRSAGLRLIDGSQHG